MLACLTAVCLLPGRAEAGGIATDTLTVKAGYYGMDSSRYVEAGTYHWTELQENLTMYYEAYTFFRPTGEGDYRVVENSGSSAETPGENNPGADSSPTVKRDDQRMLLLMTGLGALLVAAMGAGARVLYFKKERDE
ncbi:MAG: hypothetical protein UF305_06020 [Oscillospiraceae bacterium]|nr:hypothetical protein [Oscillospiraceae bacterium]